jgi:hypothetical protein
MMQLLTQMMGGAGGANGAFPGMPQQPAQVVVPDRYSALWRLLHTTVALGLGLYIALWTSFSGTRLERERSALPPSGGARVSNGEGGSGDWAEWDSPEEVFDSRRFFYAFATAEAVLLTTRYFLDRARPPPGGIMWSLAGFLPQPIKSYLEIGLRYSQIFTTVKSDILVCIFVLGVCSWLRSG